MDGAVSGAIATEGGPPGAAAREARSHDDVNGGFLMVVTACDGFSK